MPKIIDHETYRLDGLLMQHFFAPEKIDLERYFTVLRQMMNAFLQVNTNTKQ